MGSRGSGYEASGTGGGSGSSEYDDIITKGDGTEYYYNSKTGEMWPTGKIDEKYAEESLQKHQEYLEQEKKKTEQQQKFYENQEKEKEQLQKDYDKLKQQLIELGVDPSQISPLTGGYIKPNSNDWEVVNQSSVVLDSDGNVVKPKLIPIKTAEDAVSAILSKYGKIEGQNSMSDSAARAAAKELDHAAAEISAKYVKKGKNGFVKTVPFKKWSKEDRETYDALTKASHAMGKHMLYK